MANHFRFVVEATLDRTEGKFASRDEMLERLQDALDSANPGTVDGVGSDGTSTYEVTDWSVEEEPAPTMRKRANR